MKKTSIRTNTENVKAMIKALKETNAFEIESGTGTRVVTCQGVEVLRALRVRRADLWLVSHASDLFV